jgi:hypothetical protein
MAEESYVDLLTKALIAGNSCAFISAFLNPLDVTKIRMQNQGNIIKYKGVVSGALIIVKEEGLAGWAKGLNASMIREVTYSSVRMGAYEPIRNLFTPKQDNDKRTTTSPFVKFSAALISGGTGAALCNPFDLVKIKFQASRNENISTYSALRDIYLKNGVRGLYKGWIVTSSRAAVLTSAQLGSYDTIKNNIMIDIFHMHDGFILHFCASMASGLVTTTATNPCEWLCIYIYIYIYIYMYIYVCMYVLYVSMNTVD